MFREWLNRPIDPISEEYINTLRRIDCDPDYSLSCMGIAMLSSRIEDYKGIDGCYYHFSNEETCINDFIERAKIANEAPMFCYYRYSKSNEEARANLADYSTKDVITKFVNDKMSIECHVFFKEDRNIVGIFANSSDSRLYHLLLSFVSIYYPMLFKTKPMNPDEYEVVKSLSDRSNGRFITAIKKMVEPYATEFRRIQFVAFMKQLHGAKVERAKAHVDEQRAQLKDAEARYGDLVKALKEAIIAYEGFMAVEKYDEAEENLVKYLTESKNIHEVRFRGNSLEFIATALLCNYNVDAWEAFSRRGSVYDYDYGVRLSETFKVHDNRKKLLDAIFSDDPKFMVKMCGYYRLDFERNTAFTSSHYNYAEYNPMFESYIPNPHLQLHSCLGGYTPRLAKLLTDRNYTGAVEMCIASAGSVNLDETTLTFYPFVGQILSSKERILTDRAGNEYTPEEALKKLTEEGE